MAPRNVDSFASSSLQDDLPETHTQESSTEENRAAKRPPMQIVWRNVILFVILHIAALYGVFLLPWMKPATWVWLVVIYMMNALGITAGAHRLWAHRSYRAKLPLRIFLGICNSMAFQNDIIEWSRDHRLHHKHAETDADPHNVNRGFFFAHIGWLMVRKHPDVKDKGKLIDLSDLFNDPVCAIQRKFYLPSVVLLCFVMPAFVPWYFWNENVTIAFYVCAILRYAALLNVTWAVNSVAHLWGNRPYDYRINPVQNFWVATSACGEGYHNYHHVFPTDYSTSEHGWRFNVTTMFIDLMSAFGLAYDCKKISAEAVQRRRERTGDGTSGFGN